MSKRRRSATVAGDPLRVRVRFVAIVLILGTATPISAQARSQSGAATWEELRARPYPEWFVNAKLGIFIHWGVYSVPAYSGKEDYGEWFLRGLQVGDTLRTRFMQEHYGDDFTYRDLAPLFKAELFEPDAWAELFRRAGAHYVVLVSKHHDGYALWPSRYAPGWNSVQVGPKRDLVGDLTQAVRDAGLRMGLYYSLAEWNHPLHRWYTDPNDSIGPYVEQHMIPQFRELISAYLPEVLFTDGEWFNTPEQWHARELIDWYYDTVGPNAIVNDRWGSGSDIGFLTPEYSAGIEVVDRPWTEVRGLGRSFALNRNEDLDAYMTPAELVHRFARAVAAGGGMILNVGPKADGQIPLLQQERLLQLGGWLAVNGEAIYGSRPWTKTGEEREVTLERVDPTIDFNWVRNSPGRPIREDDFTAVWTGFVDAPRSETYTFEVEADDDDGVRVWIGDHLILERWETGGLELDTTLVEEREGLRGRILLDAGRKYPIRVEFYEKELEATVHLFWSSPSLPRQVVPQECLFTSQQLASGDGLYAVYQSQAQYLAYTTKDTDLFAITFEWPENELVIPIPPPLPGAAVRMLGLDRHLPWRSAGDTLYVDVSGVTFQELPAQWAWTICIEDYLGAR
jgi:alpha-L-fucosidase